MRSVNKVLTLFLLTLLIICSYTILTTKAMTWTNPQPITPPTYTFTNKDFLKGNYGVPTVFIPKTATNPNGMWWMQWFCNYSVSYQLTWVKYSVYDVATNIRVGDSGTEGYADAGTEGIDLINPYPYSLKNSQIGSQGYKIYFLTTNVDDWVLYVSPSMDNSTPSLSPTPTATPTPTTQPTSD